jgi:AcrR family transcriptional regulator
VTVLYGAPTARRQDAQRNRAAIVRAATEVMTSPASVIAMPEIARRAGVAQATLYRHFPDRSALAGAVIAHQLQLLEACAAGTSQAAGIERAAGTDQAAGTNQAVSFHHLLRAMLHTQIAMRPLVLLSRRFDAGLRDQYERRLVAAFAEPLRRAQSTGQVRCDFVPKDLMLLVTMVQAVAEATDDVAVAQAAADRSIELVLDGVFR